jgi:hypothetical protein
MRYELVGLSSLVWQIQPLNAAPEHNSTFKPPPEDIGSRHIRDLKNIPDWMDRFAIQLVVRSRVRMENGTIESFDAGPVKTTCYQIHRTHAGSLEALSRGRILKIVPHQYVGKIWVSTESPKQ